jgi:hypothetical protein
MQHNFDELLAADTSPLDASDALISVLIVLFRKLRENEVLNGIQIAEVLRTAGQGHAFAAAQVKAHPALLAVTSAMKSAGMNESLSSSAGSATLQAARRV